MQYYPELYYIIDTVGEAARRLWWRRTARKSRGRDVRGASCPASRASICWRLFSCHYYHLMIMIMIIHESQFYSCFLIMTIYASKL